MKATIGYWLVVGSLLAVSWGAVPRQTLAQAPSPAAPPPAPRAVAPPAGQPAPAPPVALPVVETEPEQALLDRLNQQTLGGVLLWGDELFFHDWRIQRHVLTGHCRLLDGDNRRHAWGTYDQCLERLNQIKQERHLPPMSGRAVVLVHGLGGVRATMTLVGNQLEQHGYKVFNVTYPSTRGDLAQHARALGAIVDHLDGVEEINFVGHSMGNLVIRHYLGDCADTQSGRKPDPRLKRVVMIAPPNHGAEKARAWGDSALFLAVVGAGGMQLGAGWETVEKHLATPACEFGIIAGGQGDNEGYSDKLPGDDDSLITVSTTRLVGARDFVVLPHRHNLLLLSSTTADYIARFIERGYFRSAEQRQPITQ